MALVINKEQVVAIYEDAKAKGWVMLCFCSEISEYV
jgi:hypothetical protein